MKPSNGARHAAAITFSKGKMYEYGIPNQSHIALPHGLDLAEQFPLAIGTLGDCAASITAIGLGQEGGPDAISREDLVFAARVLQGYDEARLQPALRFTLRLLAAAGYYLADMPGTATVQVRAALEDGRRPEDEMSAALCSALDRPWAQGAPGAGGLPLKLAEQLGAHYAGSEDDDRIAALIQSLRAWARNVASPHELLLADVLCAVATKLMANSAWTLLPRYTGVPRSAWTPYLKRKTAIKEMWPSQQLLGERGLLGGRSGIVQMPVSSGKSRAIELLIRGAFLAGRTSVAVVVAPFRALCDEIAEDLRASFYPDSFLVNHFTDVMQPDFDDDVWDILEEEGELTRHVFVVTPEKLMYVLRQEPGLADSIGLVIYDEGHQFDTGPRGVTYELLLTSIKRTLPPSAQTVLFSAVVQNAEDIATWLLVNDARVVVDRWPQTRRLVAFVSLPEKMTGQLQFVAENAADTGFFVPRVILRETLARRPREVNLREFPTNESGSIAIYLGLRLVVNGGVAIYARTKASAAKIVREAVQNVFERGVGMGALANASDQEELGRLAHLYRRTFGDTSYLARGAELGIVAHHGNSPHGTRLCIEYAMRFNRVRMVVCTSTLAQGVNLPIRYLLVSSSQQGREPIPPRDFRNLMGRAGRAGMYGEGTVIFTNPKLYDDRMNRRRRWESTLALISAESGVRQSSTLLEALDPLVDDYGGEVQSAEEAYVQFCGIVDDLESYRADVMALCENGTRSGLRMTQLAVQAEVRVKVAKAIESFLMTYRPRGSSEDFSETARLLARETLAYALADSGKQAMLERLFAHIASRIDERVADVGTQGRYGRALLGVDDCVFIDKWVAERVEAVLAVESSEGLFEVLWPVLSEVSGRKEVSEMYRVGTLQSVGRGWIQGMEYSRLFSLLDSSRIRPSPRNGLRSVDVDGVVGLCEQTFGYEFCLLIAALRLSISATVSSDDERYERTLSLMDGLQKRLKYGLSKAVEIGIFELGFSERVVAQEIAAKALPEFVASPDELEEVIRSRLDVVRGVVALYPSYFESVCARFEN